MKFYSFKINKLSLDVSNNNKFKLHHYIHFYFEYIFIFGLI